MSNGVPHDVYLGFVVSVRRFIGATEQPSVPPYGKASEYVYDVEVNLPSGRVVCQKMVPVEERYDDAHNVIPLATGRPVFLYTVAGQLQLMASEKIHVVPCGAAP